MNLIFVKFQFRAWPIFACGVIFDKPDYLKNWTDDHSRSVAGSKCFLQEWILKTLQKYLRNPVICQK